MNKAFVCFSVLMGLLVCPFSAKAAEDDFLESLTRKDIGVATEVSGATVTALGAIGTALGHVQTKKYEKMSSRVTSRLGHEVAFELLQKARNVKGAGKTFAAVGLGAVALGEALQYKAPAASDLNSEKIRRPVVSYNGPDLVVTQEDRSLGLR